MSNAHIETFTGKKFDILEPRVETVCIEDIAHAGAQMNRFTGHCRFPYPVAQHERIGSYLFTDRELALRFLLHDGSESYILDMSRPMKHFTAAGKAYLEVEAPIQALIYSRFGLDDEDPKIIKDVDTEMLYAEKQQLMAGMEWTVKWSDTQKAAKVKIKRTSFDANKLLYLSRFNELCHPADRYKFNIWQKVRLAWYELKEKF